jgi:cytochrome d ubiquinol oxidase subunit I
VDDPLLLARAQFGLNIAFHILFPSLTIALAWMLLAFRLRYHRTGDAGWLATYRLWTKIFALTFAMGVVTGIVMSFQFGTNWPGYMNSVGAIAGPLLGYEVLTAFFLEATFLGVMLFGMNRVPAWAHIGATLLVAIGTSLSAFWILALNSWMQTPAGQVLDGGQWIAGDWLAVIFNPSFPYRFAHMLIASGLTAAFVVAGRSAWRLLGAPADAMARRTMRTGIVVAAALAPLQAVVGDFHGLNTLEHQPAKIAAVEAIWHTEKGVPLVLFAIPNESTRTNDYAIELPYVASLILRHDPGAELTGLDAFGADRPPVAPVFFAFRLHVRGLGGHARRLDRHRDRAPAVARAGRAAHARRRGRDHRRAARREPHGIRAHLRDHVRRVHGRADPPGRAGRGSGGGETAAGRLGRRRGRGLRRKPWICRWSSWG